MISLKSSRAPFWLFYFKKSYLSIKLAFRRCYGQCVTKLHTTECHRGLHNWELIVMKEDKNSSELQKRAGERFLKSGFAPDILCSEVELRRVVQELSIHQIELESQKEELQHAKNQLEEALTQYTDLYDYAPVGYLTLECNSTIRKANMTAEKLLGRDRTLLIGDRFIRFVDHKERIRFNTFIERVFSHKEHLTLELLLQDDEVSALSLSGRIMRLEAIASENGHECLLTLSDITRQRQLEKENAGLQESKKLWEKSIHSLFDNFQDPVFLLDRDCTILAANKAFCDMVGKTLHELINTNGLDLLSLELRKTRRQRVEEVIVSRKPLFFEDEQYGKILRSSLYPINEECWRILVIVQNVTETRAIEQKLKSQEAFNQAIINSIPGVFYIVDHNGQFVGGNDYLRETILGDSDSDLKSILGLELLHPDDREKGRAVLERLIEKNIPPEPFEERVLYHGGPEYHWYITTASKALIDGVEYMIGVGIDINEQKKAEQALIESEERFRKLFESHAAAKLVIDVQTGSIIDANQAAAEFYGWKVEELKKMNVNQIIVLSDEQIQQSIEKASSRHRTADGSLRDVEVYSNKIEINGKLLTYCIIIDVTERKRLEALTDGIIITDTRGTITSISPMALHLFDAKEKAELLATPFTALVHARDTKKWQNILQEEPEKAASIRTLELLCKKGREEATFLAEITVLQIHGVYGALQSYQLIIRDITLHKLNENQQLHTNSLIALGEMASGVAHEITQPVNNISLLADKMLEKAKSDSLDIKNTVTKQAQKIVQNIARLQTIVDNILHFASKDQKCVTTRFDCKEPIHSAHTLTSRECTKKSIELTFHCDPEELPVKGNLYKMEQVILNLIRNSIDAIEEKRQQGIEPGTEMYIHLQAKRQKESVIISIADNGIGISRQNIDYILQPFFTTKESGKGTGLGLSISSGIIKEMHGQLNVTSTPMQGTTVQLSLPLATHPPAG